ncbi:MAG: glycosyltransferase family 1 protein [Microgenomates group bacterium]|jgi:glycosyltransferase involved in cell wall biosynthesis
MKIGFCVSALSSGHNIRGIGVYTKNLLAALKSNDGVVIQEFSGSAIPKTDIVHYPFFDLFKKSLPIRKDVPTVVTIHDVIPLAYSEFYPAGTRGFVNLYLQKLSLKNVSAVITDSKASKEDIIKYLKFPASKIYTIPLAPADYFHKIDDKDKLKTIRQKFNLPEKFALFTGNVNWNKNLVNLTAAAIKADIDVVLIGKGFEEKENLDHPELRSFKEFLNKFSTNSKVHILGFVEVGDLVGITNMATMALFPSNAEGFGLPILEAQICGTPVITSNISSMPEVAGRGALLVDPNSVESISRAISRILTKKDLREELIKEGLKNVKRFSWKKTAQETIQVYDKVLHS